MYTFGRRIFSRQRLWRLVLKSPQSPILLDHIPLWSIRLHVAILGTFVEYNSIILRCKCSKIFLTRTNDKSNCPIGSDKVSNIDFLVYAIRPKIFFAEIPPPASLPRAPRNAIISPRSGLLIAQFVPCNRGNRTSKSARVIRRSLPFVPHRTHALATSLSPLAPSGVGSSPVNSVERTRPVI